MSLSFLDTDRIWGFSSSLNSIKLVSPGVEDLFSKPGRLSITRPRSYKRTSRTECGYRLLALKDSPLRKSLKRSQSPQPSRVITHSVKQVQTLSGTSFTFLKT